RLAERGSEFRVIFDALEGIAGEPEGINEIRQQAATETPDETLLHMDEIWEEEAVSFMGAGDSCQTKAAPVSPVAITSRDQFLQAQNRSH
ncbi:MAG: nitrate reductase molybdenum cofactor assembly chaperone, partial [Methylococcaceae bacterium]